MLAGREYMGLPKLPGVIPELERSGTGARFLCQEYDALLLEGAVEQLEPLSAEKLAKVNARAGDVRTFGWKYISAPGGGADLDYPTLNVMRWDYKQAWTGTGSLKFHTPSYRDAPMSSSALAVLAELPQLSVARVFLGTGEAIIDRTRVVLRACVERPEVVEVQRDLIEEAGPELIAAVIPGVVGTREQVVAAEVFARLLIVV